MATISRVKGVEPGKPTRRLPISSADAKHDTQEQTAKHTGSEEDGRSPTEDHMGKTVVSDKEDSDDEGYTVNNILAYSGHRDGSIYRGMDTWWKKDYRIADRNETRLEAMALSDPTDCIIRNGTCMKHYPGRMLQFFSLQLAKIPVDGGLVKLYGYMAVRDEVDPLLNYIVNFSRDEPIIVEQDVLKQCKNRVILFDNETNNRHKCDAQLKKLLDIVDSVVSSKCGRPFSNQMFAHIKKAHEQKFPDMGGSTEQVSELRKDRSYDEYLAQVAKMVEEKLNKTIEKMEKQLCEEKEARQKAELKMTEAMLKSKWEMSRLRLSLEKAQQESEKAREENEIYRESEKVRREKEEETKEEIRNLKEKLNRFESQPPVTVTQLTSETRSELGDTLPRPVHHCDPLTLFAHEL
ncbi:golgin subfamily A member 6-like protein 22 [Panicum miliaceum]|uniref:Golgin subfamily A member 6-like protein 22 n=1 Tax=Panicum miliaceum TaxID=4540 RepID=A0A3L6PZ86_PANMI|nr:golgin subfamily A member 6-like protein 22 [Panicum miliaceum]